MVIAVFRSRLRADSAAEFHELAGEMLALAQTMPGFLSYRVYGAEDDDERCS